MRDIASRVCAQEFGILVAGGNVSVLCIPADIIYIGAKAIYENIALCDGIIDSAEIEGSYDRIGYIHDRFAGHDLALASNNSDLLGLNLSNTTAVLNRINLAEVQLQSTPATHDTQIMAQLALHDSEIKGAISSHDAEVKAQGQTHDRSWWTRSRR